MALGFIGVAAAVSVLGKAVSLVTRALQLLAATAFDAFRTFESTSIALQASLASQLKLSDNAATNPG